MRIQLGDVTAGSRETICAIVAGTCCLAPFSIAFTKASHRCSTLLLGIRDMSYGVICRGKRGRSCFRLRSFCHSCCMPLSKGLKRAAAEMVDYRLSARKGCQAFPKTKAALRGTVLLNTSFEDERIKRTLARCKPTGASLSNTVFVPRP